LKKTAQAHKKLRDEIDALVATDPALEDGTDWRAKYVEAERERVRLQIHVGRLEWLAEAGCENTPTRGCECPGCMTARERAERGEP
jgi:hypothetical protein